MNAEITSDLKQIEPFAVSSDAIQSIPLFNQGEEYEQASLTEQTQGEHLLSLVRTSDGSRILDVGCGNGLLSLQLAKRFPICSVDGIDISPNMIEVAQSHLDNNISHRVRFEVADLFDFTPDHHYDVVFSSSAMHWVIPPDQGYRSSARVPRL